MVVKVFAAVMAVVVVEELWMMIEKRGNEMSDGVQSRVGRCHRMVVVVTFGRVRKALTINVGIWKNTYVATTRWKTSFDDRRPERRFEMKWKVVEVVFEGEGTLVVYMCVCEQESITNHNQSTGVVRWNRQHTCTCNHCLSVRSLRGRLMDWTTYSNK